MVFFYAVVTCPPLMAPANGTLTLPTGREFRCVAIYQCDTGHLLMGLGNGIIRECQASGEWTESDPTCERKQNSMQSTTVDLTGVSDLLNKMVKKKHLL
jgi:hypothetical protein